MGKNTNSIQDMLIETDIARIRQEKGKWSFLFTGLNLSRSSLKQLLNTSDWQKEADKALKKSWSF